MNVARNGLIMLLKPMEMYFLVWYLSPLFRDVCVTTKLYRKPLQLQLCFTGTIVEELPTGLPCFTKHYRDAANKNLLLQSLNMERRAGTLINLWNHSDLKASSLSTINYYLKGDWRYCNPAGRRGIVLSPEEDGLDRVKNVLSFF